MMSVRGWTRIPGALPLPNCSCIGGSYGLAVCTPLAWKEVAASTTEPAQHPKGGLAGQGGRINPALIPRVTQQHHGDLQITSFQSCNKLNPFCPPAFLKLEPYAQSYPAPV